MGLKFKSKWDEIYERLVAEGKVTVIEINLNADDMKQFKQELRRKQAQSIRDTAKIFLNA